jgi:hypothetical protein
MRAAGDPIVVLRVASWKFALWLRDVERVLSAAMPVAVPSGDGATPPTVRISDQLVPVAFARGLFGSDESELRPEDKMVLLSGQKPLILWVDAVEDVVPYVPFEGSAGGVPTEWVECFSGGEQTVAILDTPKLVSALTR